MSDLMLEERPRTRRVLAFREVSFAFFWMSGGRDILAEHALEFDILDVDKYVGPHKPILDVESAGQILICEARSSREVLAGHIIWGISYHAKLQALAAKLGPWYMRPEWRGHGAKLFKFSLERLRLREVWWALPTLPIKGAVRPSRLLGTPLETTYQLDLRMES